MEILNRYKSASAKIIFSSWLAVGLTNVSWADPIVNNLSSSSNGSQSLTTGLVGQEFTLPDDGNTYNLDDITLNLLGGTSSVAVYIYSVGGDGLIGSEIGVINTGFRLLRGVSRNYTVLATTPISLSGGLSYYVVAARSGSTGTVSAWNTTTVSSPSGGSGIFANVGIESSTSTIVTGSYGIMEVDATPVATPEPDTMALAGFSVLGLSYLRRRR